MSKWRRNRSKRIRWVRNHLINKDGNKCKICKKTFTHMRDITIDHIVPLSKGGTYDILNLQLACFNCNNVKGDMTPEEFERFQDGGLFDIN